MAPSVDVVNRGSFEDSVDKVKGALFKALQFLGKENCSVDVSLLERKEMALINDRTRGKRKATTVLSFEEPREIPQVEGAPRRLGEIYLAPEVIKKKGMDPARVAVHGLLHLLGYTHSQESDTMEMENLEDKIGEAIF